MYADPDTLGKFRWRPEFINPIPFLNSLANNGNSMLGFNMKFSPYKNFQLYSQLLLDELDWQRFSDYSSIKNKTGFQLGTKFFNAFNISNLYLQFEYNQVRPYTYSAQNPVEAYTHYNEPLAHPLGANFREFLGKMNFRKVRWQFDAGCSFAVKGADAAGTNWGSDIFLNDHTAQLGFPSSGNYISQGVRTELINSSLKLSYILNPKSTLNISLGYQHHSQSSSLIKNSTISFTSA